MNLCKICHAKTATMTDIKRGSRYYRCINCGFVSLDKAFITDSKTEKKHYAKHNNSFECKGYVEMFEAFIEKGVLPYISEIKRVLDFGCGHTPVLAEILKQRGLIVDIYDLYFFPHGLDANRSYDLITSTEVFEHLSDPKAVLFDLVQRLNPKGYLILMTQFPPEDDEAFLNWWYRRDITHISFFTPKSFDIMAEEMGLTVRHIIDKNIVVFQKI